MTTMARFPVLLTWTYRCDGSISFELLWLWSGP
jgi:hypothetical protein